MTGEGWVVSRSQLDAAGRRLRLGAVAPPIVDLDEVEQREVDVELVNAYRRSYSHALLKVRMGLSSFRRTVGSPEAAITQRTKRFDRIIAKLDRFSSQRLSQMQDIGGVRIVVAGLDHLATLVDHVEAQWGDQIVRHDDYVTRPQESGYRAHHIVVRRDDRLIEIQARTEHQHTWAENVEATSRVIDAELKWGEGPEDILGYYVLLGRIVDLADRRADVPTDLLVQVNTARDAAQKRMLSIIERGGNDG